MAVLVPPLEKINRFATPLEAGERALMKALCDVLDDDWTIYVQPFLNGLQPDIIIFSENAGLGIFEVKDWNLANYCVHSDGAWAVHDSRQGKWHTSSSRCPIRKVQKYKNDIMQYEFPELRAESLMDRAIYAVIASFVYFHNHTTEEAKTKVEPLGRSLDYTTVFGHDDLERDRLLKLLGTRRLVKGSRFAGKMQEYQLQARLRNSLAYPEHGRLETSDILFPLTQAQERLLPNAPGKRRVIGAAGSGKTLLLARKAVEAALAGKKVLITCFNITMVNYLLDIVRRLVRYYDQKEKYIDRLIFVRHYNRLFPVQKPTELSDESVADSLPFDVILIDEGQDFKRAWIEQLYELAPRADAHIMFVEDDRQNIYGINTSERRRVPGIVGRPNELKQSFRINSTVAALANLLAETSGREFESGHMESAPSDRQGELFQAPKPVWYDGTKEAILALLQAEIQRLLDEAGTGAFADIVILVCNREDGWDICERMDELHQPYICNFESRAENKRVREMYPPDKVQMKLDDLQRDRKLAFRMQTGRIKVCTIHSFKGWELRRVLIFNHPVGDSQIRSSVELLYTAMTRTQESLTIFNIEPSLRAFAQNAARKGLLKYQGETGYGANVEDPQEWIESGTGTEGVTKPPQAETVARTTTRTEAMNGESVRTEVPVRPDNLEKEFHDSMVKVYRIAKHELNYTATYILRMIFEMGGLEAARRLLAKSDVSDGFTELYLNDRLDLTVEAQVVRPEFRILFTPAELAIAARRLTELGYTLR